MKIVLFNKTHFYLTNHNVLTNPFLFNKFIDNKPYPNVEKINGKNIFTHWSVVNENLQSKKVNIYCNNPKSLFVKNGLQNVKNGKKIIL